MRETKKTNMITPINEVAARLTVLEFAMVQEISSRLSELDPDESLLWKSKFVHLFMSHMVPEDILLSNEQDEAEFLEYLKNRLQIFIRNVAALESLNRGARRAHESTGS